MLLMVEKGIRSGICQAIYRFVKAGNKYMLKKNKNMLKIKNHHILSIGNNAFYEWAMSQKLSANDFGWVEETSQFNEDFIKFYNKNSDIGYFIEADVHYRKKLHELYNNYFPFFNPFFLKKQ